MRDDLKNILSLIRRIKIYTQLCSYLSNKNFLKLIPSHNHYANKFFSDYLRGSHDLQNFISAIFFQIEISLKFFQLMEISRKNFEPLGKFLIIF